MEDLAIVTMMIKETMLNNMKERLSDILYQIKHTSGAQDSIIYKALSEYLENNKDDIINNCLRTLHDNKRRIH